MSSYKIKETKGNMEWFRHDRFGMFIHFGLYSLPARHEWVKMYESVSEEKYEKYFEHFNPDLFDAKEWAKMAKKAGMKYAVLTTKHHEGFCLFDSQYTDYKSTNTAFGRDLVREYVDAFRAEGIKIGFYYSLLDWHHNDFRIDGLHPRRNDANAQELDKGRDMKKYALYMRNQVRELLTNYGKIDILWFDFSYPDENTLITYGDGTVGPIVCQDWMLNKGYKGKNDWESEELATLCRELQPDIIINNRLDIEGDIFTPEQVQPDYWMQDNETKEYLNWETCQTFSGSWGYNRDEMTWKSPEMLINMLVNTVSVGGNLIMNVGPTSRGYFDYRAVDALNEYGEWMKYNSRSIYDCTMAEPEFTAPQGTKLTQSEDGKRLYIHLQTYPFGVIRMNGIAELIDYAQFLHDGSEVLYDVQDGIVSLRLPTVKPNRISPVIEVIFK